MCLCAGLAAGVVGVEDVAAASQHLSAGGIGAGPGVALGEAARWAPRLDARAAVLDGVDGLPLRVQRAAGHAAALEGEVLVDVVLGDVVVRRAVAPVPLPVRTLAAPAGVQRGDPVVPGGVLLPVECGFGGKHIFSWLQSVGPGRQMAGSGAILWMSQI